MSPDMFRRLTLPAGTRPSLFVVVDTEEEFDWDAPFSRDTVTVRAIDEIGRLQAVLSRYGLIPTYLSDYPVVTTRSSVDRLAEFAARGECHIGAHLHPWVSPPYEEAVNSRNSYPCNLGRALEERKIALLAEAIEANFGHRPRVYKAGRYGFAASTADILERLGFDVDVSVNPHMDFRADGGPSFEGFEPWPATFGQARTLLELPCTTAFVGYARAAGPALHRAASASWLKPFKAVGLLSRTGLLNKIMLTPEESTLSEMMAVTDALLGDGVRTFALTFHSPSLMPGCTPYVRTVAEREAFLSTIDRYCDDFCGRIGGVATTPADLYDRLVKDTTP